MAYEMSQLELHSTTLFISKQNIATNNTIKEYITNDLSLTVVVIVIVVVVEVEIVVVVVKVHRLWISFILNERFIIDEAVNSQMKNE